MQKRITHAIDNGLSCLQVTERDLQTLLERTKEEKPVKKKLSVAFVLTLALVLLAVAALAVGAIRGVFHLGKAQGQPQSCAIADDVLYYQVGNAVYTWTSDSQTARELLSWDQEDAPAYASFLFYNDRPMLLDLKNAGLWACGDGTLKLVRKYSAPFAPFDMRTDSAVYADGAVIVLHIPPNGTEEDGILYHIDLESGQTTELPARGVLEMTCYQQRELLVLQRETLPEGSIERLAVLDAHTGEEQAELCTMSLLATEGIAADADGRIYAMVAGNLCELRQGEWQPLYPCSLPVHTGFAGVLSTGYVTAGQEGVRFMPFEPCEQGRVLRICGLMSTNPELDYAFEQAHEGVTVSREVTAHLCARELAEALESREPCDLYHLCLDAYTLELLQNGALAPIDAPDLLADVQKITPKLRDAFVRGDTLVAVPSDATVYSWQAHETLFRIPATFTDMLTAPPAWSREAYAHYLVNQFVRQAKPETPDFAAPAFTRALEALKQADIPIDMEGADGLLRSGRSFSFGDLFDGDGFRDIMPIGVDDTLPPRMQGQILVYVISPNAPNPDLALAFLRTMQSRRDPQTNALLAPETARPVLHAYMEEWIQALMEEQRTLDAQQGVPTDEKMLAARIDELRNSPGNHAITQEKLDFYREMFEPLVDWGLEPMLRGMSGPHDGTLSAMREVVMRYLADEISREACSRELNALIP